MGWSDHHKNGLIYHAPQHCYRGYTLLTTNGDNHVNLIDMEGRLCHQWYYPERLGYGYLLDNGNLLARTISSRAGGQRSDAGPRAGAIVELDWDGREVWRYENPLLHHDFDRLPNGNTLVLLFEALDPELAASVRGGQPDADRDVEMLGDLVEEITPEGETVYSWRSWEHLDPEIDLICHLENREEWTHQNSLRTTPEGGPDRQLPPHRYRGHCGPGDRRLEVEVGPRPDLPPALPLHVGQWQHLALRQRLPPPGLHLLPGSRGQPRQQRNSVGLHG